MGYTAIQSRILDALNNIGNVAFIAVAVLAAVFTTQICRIFLGRVNDAGRAIIFRNSVIAPYVTSGKSGRSGAMRPYFSRKPTLAKMLARNPRGYP